jgi:hypothetical protein
MLFKKGDVVEVGQSLQQCLELDGIAINEAVIFQLTGTPSFLRSYEIDQVAESGVCMVILLRATEKEPQQFLGTKIEALGQKLGKALENLGVFVDDPVLLFAE